MIKIKRVKTIPVKAVLRGTVYLGTGREEIIEIEPFEEPQDYPEDEIVATDFTVTEEMK